MTTRRFTLDAAPFKGKTGRGVRVAVVDSGIAQGHPHVGPVAAGVSLTLGSDDTLDRIGHGTAVAAAIREKAADAELVPVRVFERVLKTDAQTLAAAIRWAADNECRLINLSLGTASPEHGDVLAAAVKYASERGSLVVSAYESEGTRWLPGSLDGAIGVVGDVEIDRDALLIGHASGAAAMRITASIYPRPIPNVPRERNLNGISFAVANATGALARLVEGSGGPASSGEIGRLLALVAPA